MASPGPLRPTTSCSRRADYRAIVVAWRNGAPVLLRDVAEVTDSVVNTRLAGWFNRDPAS